jgi:hypothetical protein
MRLRWRRSRKRRLAVVKESVKVSATLREGKGREEKEA